MTWAANIFRRVRDWFLIFIRRRSIQTTSRSEPSPSEPPPIEPAPVEPPPAEPPKPPPAPEQLPPGVGPRAKWVKPKGIEKLKPQPAQLTRQPAPTPRPKTPRPKLRPDADPEQWGQFYFRDQILDQLDVYFPLLKRMRRNDRDAYDLLRQVGIQIMPQTAIQSFDKWRSADDEAQLSAWWRDHRPSFGAIAYGIDAAGLEHETVGVVEAPKEVYDKWFPNGRPPVQHFQHRLATISRGKKLANPLTGDELDRSIMWIPKFLHFQKYKNPPPSLQRVVDGDVYVMTVYWDRVDNKDSPRDIRRMKSGVPQAYGVCVERGTGKVRILNSLIRSVIALRSRRNGEKFSIPHKYWGVPTDCLFWAKGRTDFSPEDFLQRMFVEAALMYESAVMGSMIRVEVTKKNLTATFGVEIKRTSYFFKDRDITITANGRRQPIFHIVRPHVRHTKKGDVAVKMHFSGLRDFTWAGYRVAITVPARDHFALPEWDLGADDSGAVKRVKGEKYLGAEEIGQFLRDNIKGGLGAWKANGTKQ